MNGTLREQLDELLGAVEPAPVPLERIRRRALGIRLRRTGAVASVLAAAGVAAALLTGYPAPVSAPAPTVGATTQPGRPFAHGVAHGRPWQLAVQDIAGPGYRCVPGVTVNGSDADPIAPVPMPGRTTAAFISLGVALPGIGIGFAQVPPDVRELTLLADGPGGGWRELPTTTVTACGQQFRLVGFDYPLTARLRIDVGTASVAVPSMLSNPQNSDAYAQATGVWRNEGVTYGQIASGTLATGEAYGQRWSIQVTFGATGDCYQIAAGSSSMGDCGPVSTPSGLATIMALPLGFGNGGGVGYASEVSPATARVVATLSDGSTTSAVPHVVDGRKYAALFVTGSARITRLSWLNAAGATIASTTSVAQYGVTQFKP